MQVIATVLSVDPEIDPDIPAMIGASAALVLSGIPFNGPIGAARVGYIDGQYVLNPTKTELTTSALNLVVAGTEAAVLMVESEANELPEEVMLGAVVFGHQQQQAAIELIHELVEEGGKPLWDWKPPAKDEALIAKVDRRRRAALREAYQLRSKQARQQRLEGHLRASGRRVHLRPTPVPATRTRSTISCSSSRRRSCATRSCPASRASTAATRAPCGRSRSAPACCRARTARRSSRAARRRRWSSPRSAPRATSRASTR